MLNLLGEYECTMDAKGRIRLPAGLLRKLGEREKYDFVLNKGFEKHLTLYPIEVWEETVKKFGVLNPYDSDTRNFLRLFYNGATDVDLDDQQRILVPKRLKEYANLDNEVILNAFGDKIEIWDAKVYEETMNDNSEKLPELAQKVLGDRDKVA